MKYAYKIPTWDNYQHYTDRNPPWIKLHYETLSSETWVMLDDASRVLAIACMLIASRHEGKIPDNPNYIKRISYLNTEPNFKPLIDIGFLEMIANDSECKQGLLQRKRQITEKETDNRKEILELWNDLASELSLDKIRSISPKRYTHLKNRLSEGDFKEILENIKNSTFLQGHNDRNWKVNFDWLLKPDNYLKILEGKYTDKKTKQKDAGLSAKDLDDAYN